MKELVVISGKGGTGKTSVVASFAALAENKILADCDVDAADLHLVLEPDVKEQMDFSGGSEAVVRAEDCVGCGICAKLCKFEAITQDGPVNSSGVKTFLIDPFGCEGCGVCVEFCPAKAIDFEEKTNGESFVSETRHGPMVHAKLGIAEENSGKLVSFVRDKARKLATERGVDLVIIDGSPGIGCPVIASITGASLVLIVTEPTLSGLHDFKRVAALTAHFGIPTLVTVNKWDINPEMADRITALADQGGVKVVARVRYDPAVTQAQVARTSVVEHATEGIAADIRRLWEEVSAEL
ncbi:MAG: ATP-binding protein [Planctomycetes bacterium]|nr:ATP-binding protein [Planctomycetota bacterium]